MLPVVATTVGKALTVRVLFATLEQPVLVTMYCIIAVPADTPVTKPVGETVARAVLLLAHVPPVVVLDNCVVKPAHTEVVPVFPPIKGPAFTVIGAEEEAVLHPPAFVTV